MRKYFFFLLLLLLPIVSLLLPLQAQESQVPPAAPMIMPEKMMAEPYPLTTPQLFGQEHAYTVTFRGTGEAVVNLRVVLSNTTEATLSATTLTVPDVEVEDVIAYQVVKERSCIRWADTVVSNNGVISSPDNCLEYQEPNYLDYYYPQANYYKMDANFEDGRIILNFPQPLAPNATGSYMLYFRTTGYVQKNAFGAFEYNFKSLKVEDPIQNLQIGISTDQDYKLKGVQTGIDYNMGITSNPKILSDASMGSEVRQSPLLNTFYQQIGYGMINKNSSNLQPLDTYTVEGAYAKHTWQLYGGIFIAGLVIFLIFILIFTCAGYKIYNRFKQGPNQNKSAAIGSHTYFLIGGISSVVSALIITIYTFFIYLVLQNAYNWFNQSQIFIMLFLVLISAIVYPILIFGPALFIGRKQGLGWGVGTFMATVGWLLVFFFILVFMILVIGVPLPQYPIMY